VISLHSAKEDPRVIVTLVAVAALASSIPAIRASRVEPSVALSAD
jgi:ABC-type lipoprotein release transport system permease subunit